MACANGHLPVVSALIEAGAVSFAAVSKWLSVFLLTPEDAYTREVVEQDIDIANEEGNTPLHWACLNGQIEVVKVLMMHGASPAALNGYAPCLGCSAVL